MEAAAAMPRAGRRYRDSKIGDSADLQRVFAAVVGARGRHVRRTRADWAGHT